MSGLPPLAPSPLLFSSPSCSSSSFFLFLLQSVCYSSVSHTSQGWGHFLFLILTFTDLMNMCMCLWRRYTYDMEHTWRLEDVRVSSFAFLPPCRSQGLKLGREAWQHLYPLCHLSSVREVEDFPKSMTKTSSFPASKATL